MSMGLLALLDDVALLLDDTAAISKIAAKKTAGILGDDLAVNAQQASGYAASREIPVLVAITKGSLKNKAIILPLAFFFSAFAPFVIIPVLMAGGVYLAYEGFEKIYEYFFDSKHHHEGKEQGLSEEKKIKTAIQTDFILSIEIIIVALSSVVNENLLTQVFVVSFIAILATLGVYGIVALIVRLDDMGLKLIEVGIAKKRQWLVKVGEVFVASLPILIRALSVIGTLAMMLVAGGIFVHHIEALHHLLSPFPSLVGEFGVGMLLGGVAFGVIALVGRFRTS